MTFILYMYMQACIQRNDVYHEIVEETRKQDIGWWTEKAG